MHVSISFSDIHIITDTDNVCHEGDHVGSLTHGFPVGDLGFAFIQILYLQAQQVAGGGKREAGTGGIVTEQGNAQAALKYLCGNIVFAHKTQSVCQGEYSLQLVICFLPGKEEVIFVHFFEIQFV